MKTIAITIDEDILERVDRLARRPGSADNRSRIIRRAVREYLDRLEHEAADEKEARVLSHHRGRLTRQAAALVREQARS